MVVVKRSKLSDLPYADSPDENFDIIESLPPNDDMDDEISEPSQSWEDACLETYESEMNQRKDYEEKISKVAEAIEAGLNLSHSETEKEYLILIAKILDIDISDM